MPYDTWGQLFQRQTAHQPTTHTRQATQHKRFLPHTNHEQPQANADTKEGNHLDQQPNRIGPNAHITASTTVGKVPTTRCCSELDIFVPNKICGCEGHFGGNDGGWRLRAVLDILEVTGRASGRTRCLQKNTFLIKIFGKKVKMCLIVKQRHIQSIGTKIF